VTPITTCKKLKRTVRRAPSLLAAGTVLAVAIAGCGGSGKSSAPASGSPPAAHGSGAHASGAASGSEGKPAARSGEAFSWLAPAPAPKTWTAATIASGGATLFYPANWRPIPGDRGTVTAALRDSRGLYRGYLNVTPRQGAEQLAGWAAFRTRRNTREGDRQTHALAAAEGLRFSHARGSCVIDDYLSRVGSHPYREVACIVAGSRFTSVFIGATLVRDWPTLGRVIERAASAVVER
jgi:hypothetical protein